MSKRFFFLIIFFLFTGFGCTASEETPSFVSQILPEIIEEEVILEGPFQYAAPWDAELYESFLIEGQAHALTTSTYIHGGIIPHHLLVSGYIDGAFFESIADQKIETLVIIGPDHFNRGRGKISTTAQHWETVFGPVATDTDLVNRLTEDGFVTIAEDVIAEEHSLYAHLPFVAKLLPETKVVVLSLPLEVEREVLDQVIEVLQSNLSEQSVIIGSVDFSHYQSLPVANFHDDRSLSVIRSFDYDAVFDLEIDSPPTVYAVLRLMEARGAQYIPQILHDNAALIAREPEVEETTSYLSPYFVQGKKYEDEPVVTLLHVGDMMLDRAVASQIDRYGFDWLLKPLAGEEERFFYGFDRLMGNLEGPFADVRINISKEIAFRFDPLLAPLIKDRGFDLVTLANNHSYDMGRDGFEDTKMHLHAEDISFFGEQYAVTSSSLHIEGIRGLDVAFVAVNDTHPYMNIDTAIELIQESERMADTTVVTIHWGSEYQHISNAHQQTLAHQFIDAGADAVIGHHPHVVQEIEVYQDRPIFYSLGNFLFDQYFSKETQEGLAIGLVLEKNKTAGAYIFPLEMQRSQVDYMGYPDRIEFMDALLERSQLNTYTIDNYYLNLSL